MHASLSPRICVTIPGLLSQAAETRQAELHFDCFSKQGLELICFDFRNRFEHWITQPFSLEPDNVQDAIDREIVRYYRPGATERNGALIQTISRKVRSGAFNESDPGGMSAVRKCLRMPELLRPLLEIRWRELNYSGASAYVTGLLRYDLMLGGPHEHFDGFDNDPDLLKSLDQWTYQMFYSGERRKIYLHHLLEKDARKELSMKQAKIAANRLVRTFKRRATRRNKVVS